MKIIILDSVNSTQDYLKNILESLEALDRPQYLVYTHKQLQGYGRRQNQWEHTKDSLACSFNLVPHQILTLSSLEIAVLIADYFSQNLNIQIKLKWPNDLFYQDKKLGGIIIHSVRSELCVGLGINHSSSKPNSEPAKESMRIGINLKKLKVEELIRYIHSHRINNSQELKDRWLKYCHHLNKSVLIGDKKGVFIGLGEYGEARIKQVKSHNIINCISGSLRYA